MVHRFITRIYRDAGQQNINVVNKGDCVLTRWMRGRLLVPFLLPGVQIAEFEYNTPARGYSIALSQPAPIFLQIHFH
jgi:hypothetical protein